MILTREQVKYYLYQSGFRGTDLNNAINICFCESSFNTNAHNTNGEDSRGLMQINIEANPQYSMLDLFNPQINTNVAFEMFTRYGFNPWSCKYVINESFDNIYLFGAIAIGIGLLVYYS